MTKNEKLFPIGEVARLYHISVGTLRNYEKIGLLKPEYVNPDSGYRYYSTSQFECLNTIRYLRALGISLSAMTSFLNNRDIDNLEQLLLEQREAVKKKQEELDIIARKVESRIAKLKDAREAPLGEIVQKEIPARRLVLMKRSITPDNYLSLEECIRQLDHASNSVFLGKVGVGLSESSLLGGKFTPYDLVFLQLDEEDNYPGESFSLEKETCLTLRFRGSHNEAPEHYERLLAYIADRDLTITGFSKEITLIDYGFTNDENLFVTEIQIPVE